MLRLRDDSLKNHKREVPMKRTLSKKEKTFCRDYAASGDARGSAARAGYIVSPAGSAAKLLAREDIRNEISSIEKQKSSANSCVEKGLYKLAFGSVADAVRLLLCAETLSAEDAETLDLFNVSDIKMPKGGGIEIKFFDRQKALEKLASLESSTENTQSSFISALSKGADRLTEDDIF